MSHKAFRQDSQKIFEKSQLVLSERLTPRFEIVWSAGGETASE